jgi:murein L,D-transpeptidase YafK
MTLLALGAAGAILAQDRVAAARRAKEPALRKGGFLLFRTYQVQGLSGTLGPKQREGDLQAPEGFYTVDRFNPQSRFLLSLGLDYPNARDRAHVGPKPGFDIFIHGNRVSIGCLAMGDDAIQEIYLLARGAQGPIRADIFPARLTPSNWVWLRRHHPDTVRFWESLAPGYDAFERTHRVPRVSVRNGRYVVRP